MSCSANGRRWCSWSAAAEADGCGRLRKTCWLYSVRSEQSAARHRNAECRCEQRSGQYTERAECIGGTQNKIEVCEHILRFTLTLESTRGLGGAKVILLSTGSQPLCNWWLSGAGPGRHRALILMINARTRVHYNFIGACFRRCTRALHMNGLLICSLSD